MKKFSLAVFTVLLCAGLSAQTISDFETFFSNVADFENNALPADSFWNGKDLTGSFTSGGLRFFNSYDTIYNTWSGFGYSNITNDTAGGVGNQYAAITGSGFNTQTTYALGNTYGSASVTLNGSKKLNGVYATNSAYAYLSMKNGDMFAKKFGNDSTGTDPDWFKLTIKGWNNGAPVANLVDFYLADYRSANSANDYLVDKWTWIDLQTLGTVDSLEFLLTSSDTGSFGMNTPAYFCIENLTMAALTDTFWKGDDMSGGFADGAAYFGNSYDTAFNVWSGFAYSNKTDVSTAGSSNQFSAITGKGVNNSVVYAVGNNYGPTKLRLTGAAKGKVVAGAYVTNTTYAYLSMKNGDSFAKKFGNDSTGTDPDWFKLTATGWFNGAKTAQTVDFYLADYRFASNNDDYAVNDWRWLNLQPLGNVDSISFVLTSSDTGQFGMNTPAYFALDNFTTLDVQNAAPTAANDQVTVKYTQDTIVDVLANDADVDFTPLTVTVIAGPNVPGAVATVDSLNRIRYAPATGIVAKDTVVYRVCDQAGGCAVARLFVNVTSLTGIEDVTAGGLSVYPNPFSSVIAIAATGTLSNVQLFDVNGSLVKSISANQSGNIAINTTELAAGTYILKLVSNGSVVYRKVIKQ